MAAARKNQAGVSKAMKKPKATAAAK